MIIKCKECGKDVSDKAKSCPNCGAPIDTAIHCPMCGSTNVSPISTANKAVNIWAWGIFAANKILNNYECKDCKHKFK